jgi:hypothetical protein
MFEARHARQSTRLPQVSAKDTPWRHHLVARFRHMDPDGRLS